MSYVGSAARRRSNLRAVNLMEDQELVIDGNPAQLLRGIWIVSLKLAGVKLQQFGTEIANYFV